MSFEQSTASGRALIFRDRRLTALLAAEVVSSLGTQMTWLALPWFVLTTTGSPARMTFVMIAELGGFAAAGIPAGMFVQKAGARTSMTSRRAQGLTSRLTSTGRVDISV